MFATHARMLTGGAADLSGVKMITPALAARWILSQFAEYTSV
jgi:hypothetical protein